MTRPFSFSAQPLWIRASLFGAAFATGMLVVGPTPVPGSQHAAFCPSIGILLATLLIVEKKTWPVFLFATIPGAVVAVFAQDLSPLASGLFWLIHVVEGVIGALLLRAVGTPHPRLSTLQQVIEFVAIGGLATSLIGATLGATATVTIFPEETFRSAWKTWASSHLLGTLTTAPLFLTWETKRIVGLFRSNRRRIEAILLTLAAGLWAGLIFSNYLNWSRADDYLILPLVLWAPVRFGLRGAAWINLLVALLATAVAGSGHGEFAPYATGDQRVMLGLQLFLAVSTLSTLMLASVLDERSETQEQLEVALADRDVLLKEIHHRVKNNLNVVASLLNLQAGYVRDEHDAALLEEARGRVIAMSRIHERLTRSSMQTSINFGDYLESLVEEFRQSLHRDDIRIEARVEPAVIDIDRAISCGLIVNELATNSLTHAFPLGRSGTITIGFTSRTDGTLRMTVRDDGIGIPPGTDLKGGSSMGMMVVNSLVHQLDGTMSVQTDGGSEFTIDVPALPARKSRTA